MPGARDRGSIHKLVLGEPPLVGEYISLEEQLQPNGFDLTLRSVASMSGEAAMGRDSSHRQLPDSQDLDFDGQGWLHLSPGAYLITFNEVVALPLDLMALGRPRSSLLRSGVSVHTAVWDAGYRGRSQALLVVHTPQGYHLQEGARLMQLVFFSLCAPVSGGYRGRYQAENL